MGRRVHAAVRRGIAVAAQLKLLLFIASRELD